MCLSNYSVQAYLAITSVAADGETPSPIPTYTWENNKYEMISLGIKMHFPPRLLRTR